MRKIVLIFIFAIYFQIFANEIYFPPKTGEWESITPESLNWNLQQIDSLYDFLDKKNSKAFILLIDGKIVLEKYFDSFTKDSNWYWASAGKTLTAGLVGIAQEEKLLSISDKTSKYLGAGWTSLEPNKEDLITIRNQLTMSSGLDYTVEDLDCTDPECLKYKADAGTQWFYHNAAYTLLEDVVEEASKQNYNIYFSQKIKNITGMNGLWIKTGFNNVYYSNPRSMARYGILVSNNGNWESTNVIKDKNYINQMINTSQDLNKSYGYLWWLNGKESCMIPGLPRVFERMLMSDAPHDLYSALGKNGQILSISPSKGIVMVRMGDRPDDQLFISTDFCNQIWQYLNKIIITTDVKDGMDESGEFSVYPNPAGDCIEINLERCPTLSKCLTSEIVDIKIYNTFGELVLSDVQHLEDVGHLKRIDISHLPVGLYFIQIGNYSQKFMVVR